MTVPYDPSSIIHHPVPPRPPLHILPPQNPAHHRDAGESCGHRGGHILGLHATDDHTGPSSGLRQQGRGTIEPECSTGVVLSAGAVQRTDPPIVGREAALDFLRAPDRGTQQETGGGNPACPPRWKVVRTQVDSGRASREGNVEPIVHEDRDRKQCHQMAGQGEQLAVGGVLEPQLDGGDAARHGGARHGDRIACAQEGVVGHEQETEGGG
jgi:hypothetical protein